VGEGDAEYAQGFDGSVLGVRDAGASAVQCGAGCVDRVEIVVLAFASVVGPVGPVDFRDHHAGFDEVGGPAGAVDPAPSTPLWARSPSSPIPASIAR
jgi:hypothetical protein